MNTPPFENEMVFESEKSRRHLKYHTKSEGFGFGISYFWCWLLRSISVSHCAIFPFLTFLLHFCTGTAESCIMTSSYC